MIKRKPLELPPDVSQRLLAEMHSFHAAPNKADAIASDTLQRLRATTRGNF
jgi:hypothetical protein